jgi:hypothetical protein
VAVCGVYSHGVCAVEHNVERRMLCIVVCAMQLFERTLKQFQMLYTRKAYLENFKSMPMFAENYDEFDDSAYGFVSVAVVVVAAAAAVRPSP